MIFVIFTSGLNLYFCDMVFKTLYIDKPSSQLLQIVRKMRDEKEANKKDLASKRDVYFPKK